MVSELQHSASALIHHISPIELKGRVYIFVLRVELPTSVIGKLVKVIRIEAGSSGVPSPSTPHLGEYSLY